MAREWKKIGQLLIERGIISKEQLDTALKEQSLHGGFIGEILCREQKTNENQVFSALGQQLGIAFIDLNTITVDAQVLKLVSKELCLQNTLIPLFLMGTTLTVAMIDPLNTNLIQRIEAITEKKVKAVFGTPSAIKTVVEKHYPSPNAPTAHPAKETDIDEEEKDPGALQEAANLASVVETVNTMISKAVEMKASDIHIEPRQESFNYRYRIDGILYEMKPLPFKSQSAIISRIKIMANMDIAEKRLPQDGRTEIFTNGKTVDLRISTFPTIHGENVVIRILDHSSGVLNLTELGFSEEILEKFKKLIYRPYGIILVTGPTGSGKTTTLYAALNEINNLEKNIMTLEDPVEYELPFIRQSQVNPKAGLTFAKGLRSIVRQDPDVIMIGEIRDKETADIAIHAALTGHLVFSTLHTNDAPSAFTRLIDMGVEPFLVSSAVIGVIAQRLIRTLCDQCKQEYTPLPEVIAQFGALSGKPVKFYKEQGCDFCKNRGYSGRSAIYELCLPDEKLKGLVTKKESASVLREETTKSGMKTLRDAGLKKIQQGVTSLSEILRVTEE
ncbi:MAG: Flp pilus assembly complex ATPase component TadA [Candidatus Omnitrophica bacterium]|nr:Flp pilus assembly complex ATPase component TadA [Candidatus Omnitrophota bacterium]